MSTSSTSDEARKVDMAIPVPSPKSLLDQIGVTMEILRDAVLAGEQERYNCTPNDVPMMSGTLGWGRTLRTLRDLLAPLGWVKDDSGSFSVRRSDGKVQIIVQTGDERTGLPADVEPRSKNPKGDAVATVVRGNAQLRFGFMDGEPRRDPGVETWILLIASIDGEARSELSLPFETDAQDGRITGWRYRIVLPPIPFRPDFDFTGIEDTGEVDFEIRKKGNSA